jgi:hypothetical protein
LEGELKRKDSDIDLILITPIKCNDEPACLLERGEERTGDHIYRIALCHVCVILTCILRHDRRAQQVTQCHGL